MSRKASVGTPGGWVYSEMSDTPTITPKPNGPLIIQGPVRIVTPDGRDLPVPPRKDGKPAEVIVLCRCGGSATKPFCDGTHKRNGFSDAS
ncbi:MAG TPA: CDGSH iron-sulfur domain-containing protein [Gemmatimonadales bacterium]|nr:CDGSH iron-sulfur domain-containing protein [Gemmatimonadales bacterium]